MSQPLAPTSSSRYWNDRTILLFLIGLLAFMTLAPLATSLFTTTDDIYAFAGIGEGWRSPWIFDARRSGRLQHVFDGQLMTMQYGWGIYWLQKTLALGSILANVLTLFMMVRRISGDARFAALAVVGFFAFVQNTWDHNLLTAYPFTFHLGLTLFFLSVTLWWDAVCERADAARARRLRILSGALFFISLFVYESFLTYTVVFPALTFAATGGRWRERMLRALRGPHMPLLVLFMVMFVLFRVFLYTDEGRSFNTAEQYVLSLAPDRVLKVLQRYAAAAMPMHYFRIYRDLVKDFYLGYGSPRPRLFDIFRVLDGVWLVRGLIVAFLVASLTANRTQVHRRVLLLVIALVLIVGSNLPLAVTAKYQSWVIDSYSRGYVMTYFVFFGVVIVLTLLADGAVAWLARRSRPWSHVLVGLFAVVAFILSYGTDFVNAHIAVTQRRMYDRSAAVDAWMGSPEFKAMPDGSVVYAPSLWDKLYAGETTLFDDYWDHHMMHVSRRLTTRIENGVPRFYPQIYIVHTFKEFATRAARPESQGKLYYLKAMQERRSDATYLVAAKIEAPDGVAPLRSPEVSVYAHARADRFAVMGRLTGVDPQCRARLLVDGQPSSRTYADTFAAEIDRTRHGDEWILSRVQAAGGTIEPESVVVTDSSEPIGAEVTLEFENVADSPSGFYEDEFVHRWATDQATITLQNRSERPVTVDLLVELHIPSAQGRQMFPVTVTTPHSSAQWSIGSDFQKHSVRVEVPPLGKAPVTFKTPAPRLPNEARGLVMMFAMPVRLQEVSCAPAATLDAARDEQTRAIVN